MVISNYATMQERIKQQLTRPRFQMTLAAAFGLTALALSVIGIYGMMAAFVAGRRRELGVRVALGASRTMLLVMVLRQAMAVGGADVVAGVALAAGAARVLRTFLYGITPGDSVTYFVVAVAVLTVAAAASFIPARRAATTDPLTCLRAE